MLLIKQVSVFSPDALGVHDVLIAGDKFVAIAPSLSNAAQDWPVTVIDGRGKALIPGLVDSLVHITGGGGEGGFHTRTPEMQFTEASLFGVTTLIGVLGTDAISRSLDNLLAKAQALTTEGLSVYCHTGSYHVPVATLTGNIQRDLMLIDKVIGVGEVAIADHRGSQISADELARIAAETKVGGLLSGKKGIVSIHVGESPSALTRIYEACAAHDVSLHQFYPTHMNRNPQLLEQGIQLCKDGGFIDFTTSTTEQIIAGGEIPAAEALAETLRKGAPSDRITMSSDGNASLPVFDDFGNLVDLQVGRVGSLYQAFVEAVQEADVELNDALASVTRNPARILGLSNKGEIAVGKDADCVLVEPNSLHISDVISRGNILVKDGAALVKGTFE